MQQHYIVEQALNSHVAVREAIVLNRQSVDGIEHLLAYVVAVDRVSADLLNSYLEATLPDLRLPDNYLFLSAIPVSSDGEIDVERLFNVELIDTELIQNWRQELKDEVSVDQFEVLEIDNVFPVGSIHRLEILSGLPGLAESKMSTLPPEQLESSTSTKKNKDAKPAISHGATLLLPENSPQTLSEILQRTARQYPDHGVTYVSIDGAESFQTYPELLSDAEKHLKGLLNLGLKQGDKVIFQLPDNREFMVIFWACILGGMVPVPVSIAPVYTSSNAVVQKLANTWQLLEKPLIISSDDLTEDIRAALNLPETDQSCVQSIAKLIFDADIPAIAIKPDDLTLLLLTSGSTGMPKAVMHSHSTLLGRSASAAELNNVSSDDVSLNWMPLDHVGGVVMHNIGDIYTGSSQIHVATQWILEQPLRWLDLIDRYKASMTWAPNFSYALVADNTEEIMRRHWDLSSMRIIINGGEAVVAKTAKRFLALLAPHKLSADCMYPVWGMSETASGSIYSRNFPPESDNENDSFTEIGVPLPNMSLRIVGSNNQLLNEGEKGNLQVRGTCVTIGYLNNPEANNKAFTDDGWFDTGDAGFLLNGKLTLTARVKDEIVINGVNYPAEEIETIVDAIEGVELTYSVACAVRRQGSDTDELAVFFCPESFADGQLTDVLRLVSTEISSIIGITPACIIPLQKQQIPKTNIGKIQHFQLKQGFESGQYDAELIQADRLTAKNIMPDWFYRKVWYRKEPVHKKDTSTLGLSLVFIDKLGLGETVCTTLSQQDLPCVAVNTASGYKRHDMYRYDIDPLDPEHYIKVISATQADGLQINQIIHLLAYQDDQPVCELDDLVNAQSYGVFSILYLVKALAENVDKGRTIRLFAVSSGSQIISANDSGSCKHSAVSGLMKSASLELSWLQCHHMDVAQDSAELNARCIINELLWTSSDEDIAYRNGKRYTWKLQPVSLSEAETDGPLYPIKQGGLYLISGGLGGIGSYFARFMKKYYQAKLVLIGITPLPDRETWVKCLDQGGKVAERIRQFLSIESLGGELIYQSADVSDLKTVNQIISQAEELWGESLAGVIHLAAGGDVSSHWQDMESHYMQNEAPAAFENMYNAKVYGTWALAQLVNTRPEATFVTFSSAIGLFGGAGFSAYSSAHTFMDAFVLQQQKSHRFSYCFNWSVWEAIGRSEADPVFAKDLYQASGYFTIPKKSGLDCFIAGLLHNQHDLIIGLDASKQNIRQYLPDDVNATQKLKAFYTLKDPTKQSDIDLAKVIIKDSFDVLSHCGSTRLEKMPLTDSGEIDQQVLLEMERVKDSSDNEIVLPKTDLEEQIASIWNEVLAPGRMGIQNSFFQLGGNSLKATQVLTRVRHLYQIDMDMRDIFEHATIEKMAALVEQRQNQTSGQARDNLVSMDPETLLANVENMTDSQVAELLAQLQSEEKG